MWNKCVIIILSIICSLAVRGQRLVDVIVDYTYYGPSTQLLDEAKINAFEQGKIQAISNEFGTIVSSVSSSMLQSAAYGNEIDDFFQLNSSDIKGEWIETKGEPEYDIQFVENEWIIHVKARGVIREIVSAPVDFIAKVLCNGIEDKFERTDFHAGDDLFLSFRTPVDGYLAVYLMDNDRNVYCLLPYQGQDDGIYKIEKDRRYVLFSRKDAPLGEREFVDEYIMAAENDVERNQIYVIFSPNPYTKAIDAESAINSEGLQLPRQLSYMQFQEWLSKCRRYDKQMRVEKTLITIKK